jgi:hypothetical protein
MINRHERRKANKGKPKARKQAVVRSEVYSMTGKDGEPLHLDVVSMRAWAEQHSELVRVAIDFNYVERLFSRGAVTGERIMGHTITQMPKPIIVCLDINEDGDEIVDGNHTYVAIATAWVKAREWGLPGVERIEHPWADGYVLSTDQWKPFVIPPSMFAKKPT